MRLMFHSVARTQANPSFKTSTQPARVVFQGKTPQVMEAKMKQRFKTLSPDNVTVLEPARRYEIQTDQGIYTFQCIPFPYQSKQHLAGGDEYWLTSPKGSSVMAFFEDSSSSPWEYTAFQESPKHHAVRIEDGIGFNIGRYLMSDLFRRLLDIKAPEPSYEL